MKPRILLINPWIHDFAAFSFWARPLGLLKVAEYLSAFDADLQLIDCMDSFEPDGYGTGKYRAAVIAKPAMLPRVPRYYKRYGIRVEEFEAAFKSVMPVDIILLTSIMTYWYPGVQEVIRLLRRDAPDVPIILGGIYPTLYPDHASRNSGADYVFSGPVDDRLPVVFRSFGITLRPVRQPVPYYRLGLYRRYPFAPLLTSTGCPYRCSYCASGILYPEYRKSSADVVLQDIQAFSSLGVADFAFYDDALLHDAGSHLKPLLNAVISKCFSIRFHTPNGLHARFIDHDLAALMRAAGFSTIRLSLESVDRNRQAQSGGKVVTEELVQSVRLLQKNGFTKRETGVYLMYGLPGQEFREVGEGIAFLKSLNVRIHLAEFSPIRGTRYWGELVGRTVIPDDLDPLLTNNTVFSFLYSGYDPDAVERMKNDVKEYNRV